MLWHWGKKVLPFFLVLHFIPFPVFSCITTSYGFLSLTRSSRCTAYAKGWTTKKHRFHFRQGKVRSVFSKRSFHTASEVHSASSSLGTGGSFPRDTQKGRQADRSFSSSSEVGNKWSYNSSPPHMPAGTACTGTILPSLIGSFYFLLITLFSTANHILAHQLRVKH
jgi:hypothetical protein